MVSVAFKPPSRSHFRRIRPYTIWIVALTALASVAIVRFELFERLHRLTQPYEAKEVDELLLVAVIVLIAAVIHSFLRAGELQAEVKIREERENHANALALFDPLTGLPNRRSFIGRLDRARADRRRKASALAVVMIDLDRFKPVNDIHGHAAGDEVLIEVAKRFSKISQSLAGTTIARMGGDEFACMVEYPEGVELPLTFAELALSLVRLPIATQAGSVEIGASIGIAVDCEPAPQTAELLRRADHAMYRAKQTGRNGVRFFDAEMAALARDIALVEKDLSVAIARGEIVPYYQQIVRLADGEISGFECLVRWTHPERGLLEAKEFIRIAESSELIDLLSLALFRAACADACQWPAHLSLSFNLAAVQLRNSLLSEQILRTLDQFGIEPQRLIIEVTESGLFADFEVAQLLINHLRAAGVSFALDDFGTGYSSLSHLRQLPFNRIKIDHSFIEGIDIRREDSLVTAIIRMGHSLGLQVVAEGVDNQANLNALRQLGCEYGQGYFLGRALSAEAVQRLFSPGAERASRSAHVG